MRSMRKFAIVTATLVLCLAGFASQAHAKYGYIDFQRILDETPQGKAAKAKLEKSQKDATIAVKEKRLEFQQFALQLQKQKDILSKEALREKQQEYLAKQTELQRFEYEQQTSLERTRIELLKGLVKEVREVAQKIGKSEGYSMILLNDVDPVLESGFVIYGNKRADVTDKAIKYLIQSSRKKKKSK
ncbi:MAG: OmpH family outer membrane protein [Deltaproteobacteria bacterium]|nr:MAG: OmpH family outer membrane protein [Deltaproteobacteria bacterium]